MPRGNGLPIRLLVLLKRASINGNKPHRPSRHRTFCTDLKPPHVDQVNHEKTGIQANISVVRNIRDAAHAVTALLQLEETKEVAWSVQKAKYPDFESYPYTLSAYGGEQIDFGNGPYLFLPVHQKDGNPQPIWQLFHEYFASEQSKKIWHDYSVVQQILSTKNTVPKGVSAELIGMTKFVEIPSKNGTLEGLARAYLREPESGDRSNLTENSSFPKVTRPWEKITKRNKVHVDEAWINAACADAKLVYSLRQKLRLMLRTYLVQNEQSSLASTFQLTNMDQVYNHFFVPMVGQLHAIQNRGVLLDNTELNANKELMLAEARRHEQGFLRWASTFSPNATDMDPYNRNHLRQVLFGPQTTNTDQAKISSCSDEEVGGSSRGDDGDAAVARRKLKAVALKGYGAKAAKLTQTLSPSMSDHALRQAVKFGKEKKEGFERNDSAFCDAVEKLLRAKELRAKLDGISVNTRISKDNRRRAEVSYSVCGSPTRVRLPGDRELNEDSARKGLVAKSGNTLLTGQYLNLDAELLFYFSGCKELEGRLETGYDVHEQLALDIFDEIKVAFEAGHCILNTRPQIRNKLLGAKTLSEMFPGNVRKAKALNWCMIRGCSDTTVRKIVGVEQHEGQRLKKTWHKLHPGVSLWQKRFKNVALENPFVETLMGRKITARTVRNRRTIKMAMGDVLGGLMEACAEEIYMQAVIKLGNEQTLQALGWHVVFLDGDTITMEGPVYAAAVALDILEYEMEVVLGSRLPVQVMGGDCIRKLRMLTRDTGGDRNGVTKELLDGCP